MSLRVIVKLMMIAKVMMKELNLMMTKAFILIKQKMKKNHMEMNDEEYVRINEELYDDVNVEMKDAKPANEGKGDEEMTDAEQSTPLPIPTSSTLTTTEAPTSTSVNPESETHTALQHRVSDLEKEVKELKQVDLSTTLRASIRSEVPPAVNKYLGSTLGDALQKELQKHT
ncbi:hypothetical protein Tco_0024464 [Tanacetum coccineum]